MSHPVRCRKPAARQLRELSQRSDFIPRSHLPRLGQPAAQTHRETTELTDSDPIDTNNRSLHKDPEIENLVEKKTRSFIQKRADSSLGQNPFSQTSRTHLSSSHTIYHDRAVKSRGAPALGSGRRRLNGRRPRECAGIPSRHVRTQTNKQTKWHCSQHTSISPLRAPPPFHLPLTAPFGRPETAPASATVEEYKNVADNPPLLPNAAVSRPASKFKSSATRTTPTTTTTAASRTTRRPGTRSRRSWPRTVWRACTRVWKAPSWV